MATGTLAAATTQKGRTATRLNNGASPTATDGDNFANTGKERLAVWNPEASACDCSFTITHSIDGQVPTAKTVSVPAGDAALIGPFPSDDYGATVKVTCALAGAGSLANVKLKVLKFD